MGAGMVSWSQLETVGLLPGKITGRDEQKTDRLQSPGNARLVPSYCEAVQASSIAQHVAGSGERVKSYERYSPRPKLETTTV
jgi:hypothetical protein